MTEATWSGPDIVNQTGRRLILPEIQETLVTVDGPPVAHAVRTDRIA